MCMIHDLVNRSKSHYSCNKHLQMSCRVQIEFFLRFQDAHPKTIVGQKVFESLKPFFVKTLKDKNTHCCIYHTKMNELRLAFNIMRTRGVVHENQICDYAYGDVCGFDGQPCQTSGKVYKGITQMWETIVCPKNEFDEWHKRICLFGNYSKCGMAILPLCPNEAIGCDFAMVQ